MNEEKQPFVSHLKELRDRLVICLIAIAVAFIGTFYWKEYIFRFLMDPFIRIMPENSSFVFIGVTEAFLTYFKLAFVSALFVTSPVVLFEIWRFVAPGLYEKEKKYAIPFIVFGSLFFIGGALFCYYLVMPVAFRFFVSYAAEYIIPMPDIKSYMNLTLKMLVVFGLIFQLPLLSFFLARAGIIRAATLRKKRRYAILGVFIVSALFTPPDMAGQLFLAIPLWGLYELSILIARIFGKKEISYEAA